MMGLMAQQQYHTLFVYDQDDGHWYDVFGDFDLDVVRGEVDFAHYDTPRKHMKIIKHRYDSSVPAIAYDLTAKGRTSLGSAKALRS